MNSVMRGPVMVWFVVNRIHQIKDPCRGEGHQMTLRTASGRFGLKHASPDDLQGRVLKRPAGSGRKRVDRHAVTWLPVQFSTVPGVSQRY